MKYIVLFAVIFAVYMFWRNERRNELQNKQSRPPPQSQSQSQRANPALPQDMVQCAACALHLPRNEALAAPDGRLYCTPEHLRGAG